ncbi:MAG: DEAD/DEAH box helicase family protein [candidate division WOR-3 bacterium]|nr:DEAD/DEAH box helicase family protein [candidate division WOR-3 bacterium]
MYTPKNRYHTESDTRAKLIDPLLKAAGWGDSNIIREFCISKGKVIIEGSGARRGTRKFCDYLLTYNNAFPIAVIEAKSIYKHWADGLSEAKEKAQIINVLFAYSTNGEKFEEFDFTTNRQTTLDKFPTPDELYQRWSEYTKKPEFDFSKLPKDKNPFLYPLYYDPQKEIRYYQLQAITKVIEAILRGQKRVLLTLATGTGKTFVALQIVWKLWKTGYLKKVLYLTDRAEVLRDQAYNEFKAFGDARDKIIEGKTPKVRDIYFATYQTLYSGDESHRLYQNYPPDFFDMIIIDECHRSGWNRWYEILQYFKDAIQLGMTATPKRDDNIDTYKYFGEPVYKYDIEQGIEDGYLANYQVQRIYTNLVKDGLNIKEAELKGAEIFVPEDDPEIIIKDIYRVPDFERTITIPEHTEKICQKICELLERYGPMDKTIIYCVTIDHAGEVKKHIQNHFAYLGYHNYAVRIVADDEADKKELENFRDSEKQLPVVATTVDLLTTGVDIPSVKNIIFLKPVSSLVMFNQIIGRGTRIDESSNKLFFRIIDFTGATRLFPQLVKERKPVQLPEGPCDYFYKAQVFDAETGQPLDDVRVVLTLQPHKITVKKTSPEGIVFFENLPRYPVHISFEKTGYNKKEFKVQPVADFNQIETVTLTKEKGKRKLIQIQGVDVYIATEEEFLIEAGGRKLNKAEYVQYSQSGIRKKVFSLEDLKNIWLDDEKREDFITDLVNLGISPQVLSSVILGRSDIDGFDVLAHIAFDAPIISRDERARALLDLKQKFINSFPIDAREIIFDLIEQYRIGGIDELKPEVFKMWRFVRKYGDIKKIIEKLKTKDLQPIFNKLKSEIYG